LKSIYKKNKNKFIFICIFRFVWKSQTDGEKIF